MKQSSKLYMATIFIRYTFLNASEQPYYAEYDIGTFEKRQSNNLLKLKH